MSEQDGLRVVVPESPPEPLTVEWEGESFAIADEVGVMSRIWFGKLAEDGEDAESTQGAAAISDMLEDCLADGEYPRFRAHARSIKATMPQILHLCGMTIEALAERPTVRPSDSSDGPPTTNVPSSDAPLARVLARIPATRPDLKSQVVRAHEAQQALSASA